MPGGTLLVQNMNQLTKSMRVAKLHLIVCAYGEYRALLMQYLGQHTTSLLMLTQHWASLMTWW